MCLHDFSGCHGHTYPYPRPMGDERRLPVVLFGPGDGYRIDRADLEAFVAAAALEAPAGGEPVVAWHPWIRFLEPLVGDGPYFKNGLLAG